MKYLKTRIAEPVAPEAAPASQFLGDKNVQVSEIVEESPKEPKLTVSKEAQNIYDSEKAALIKANKPALSDWTEKANFRSELGIRFIESGKVPGEQLPQVMQLLNDDPELDLTNDPRSWEAQQNARDVLRGGGDTAAASSYFDVMGNNSSSCFSLFCSFGG